MTPPDPNDPERNERAEHALRGIAEQVGYYVTAAKVRVAFDALSSNRNTPTNVSYKQIYRIVTGLMRRHIEEETANIIGGHTPIGPNIFGSFCSDLIENCISGHGIVAATQETVTLSETLLRSIIDNPSYRVILVPFVEALVRGANDQVASASGRRTPVPRKREPGEGDNEVRAQLIASWDAARYLAEYTQHLLAVCNGLSTISTAGVPSAAESNEGLDKSRADAYVGYLLSLVELSKRTAYPALSAMAHQRAGRVLWAFSVDRGRENFYTAASEFEVLGDQELEFRLAGLAALRYQRAAEIFARMNCEAEATRTRGKLAKLARPTAPRQS